MITNYCTLILIIAVLFSCSPDKSPDTTGVRKELLKRELVHATESEIIMQGEILGKAIVANAQQTLQSALVEAIEKQGLIGAIDFCKINAYPLIKSLEDSLNLQIKRVSQKTRNPMDLPDSIENEILNAYDYNFSPTNATSQIQVLDELNLIYTHPIAIGNGLCLNCHGTPGENMPDDVYQHILSIYPEDKAIGYALGELRGMWSIKIPKRSVINQL